MTSRDHLQKMSVIGDQANIEGKHLYQQLTGCMSAAELRQRQEIMLRNQMMATNSQVVMPNQQRMHMIPSPFEPRLLDRDMLPSTDLIIPNDTRQSHMASQYGHSLPTHTGILSNRVFPGPGYSLLQTEPMDLVARRQELMQKQNMSRIEMEMNAIYQPREIDKSHRKGFAELDQPFLYHGMAPNPIAVRGRQVAPEGHFPADMFVHRNAYESLHGGTVLKTAIPYPSMSSLQRERARRPGRRAGSQKAVENNMGASKTPTENKPHSPPITTDEDKDNKKEEEEETLNKSDQVKTSMDPATDKSFSETREIQEKNDSHNAPREAKSRAGPDKGLTTPGVAFEDRFIYQPPYSFPVTMNSPLLSGAHSLFLNREDVTPIEDMRKWTSEDVYNFVISLPGCSSYAQVFKDHDIDGMTLPLLTEEHLLDTMGLKLGPALKIRSQISCRLGNIFHVSSLPLPGALPSTAPVPSDHASEAVSPLPCNNSGDMVPSSCQQDQDPLKAAEKLVLDNKENPCDLSMAQTDFQMNFPKS
ncbi:sterile alpha motif domain-containing protein 7 [Rhinophrynus dorsalis]